MYSFLRRPPSALRDTLLDLLTDPAHVGCGHIRLMLQHSEDYGIRRELAVSFLRAAWRLWWRGAPEILITMLPGEHEEAAVVNVRLEEEVWNHSSIPLISPFCCGSQMFLNHPDAANFLRRALVEFHTRGHGPSGMDASRRPELHAAIDRLAQRQLTTTLGHLAQGLPVYDVVFRRDGGFEVRES